MARHTPAERPLTIVEVGSGNQRTGAALAEEFGGYVYAVRSADSSSELGSPYAQHPKVTDLEGSAGAIQLPDETCDVVLLDNSIWLPTEWHPGLREAARLLRPGGVVLFGA